MHMVSIVCPIYNEKSFIVKCLESIISQDYPINKLEVWFVDGMSNDETRLIVQQYIVKYGYIKLLDNPKKIVPYALNIGIKASNGDVIIRLDGHCIYPSNYVSTLVKYLFELNADNVGCGLKTIPAKDGSICKAIAIASSHKFGVGNSMFRVGANEIIETDTVPFGCFRREVFDKVGLFDVELIRNQDDEFNARIIKNGGKVFLIPQISIDYMARDTIRKTSRMYYQYGLFKPLVNKKLGFPATVRQFFPAMFVLSLIFGAFLGCFSRIFLAFYLTIIALYILIALFCSIQSATKNNDWKLMFILPFVFFVIHFSYGWGYWVGLFKVFAGKKFGAEVNR